MARTSITDVVCMENGAEVFAAERHPAIAANPYFVFWMVVADSGTITCKWTGDNGFSVVESVAITVA